jgi:HlyD family secretion protein
MSIPLPKPRQLLRVLGLAVLIAGLVFMAFRLGPLAPMQVTVTQVRSEGLTPSLFGIGSVEARQNWLLGPTVAGRVLRVHVDVGQRVKAGQMLAEMDPVDMDARVQAQDAALSRAASVQAAADAQVRDAEARRALASTNLSRQSELARQNFISSSALEVREQEWQSAEASLQAAKANRQAARQDVQRLQAERVAVLQQRQNTRLLAPADAVVISRDAEAGSTVVAGQPVLKLAHPASLWVKWRVDQGRSSGLVAGLPAQIVLRSRPLQALSGRVERVEWQADPVTEERIAQVRFDQVPAGVSMGEMAEVTLQLPLTRATPVVPQASVHSHQGQTGVWRIHGGKLDFVPVQWGMTSLDGRVQALRGLEHGETVVVYSERPLAEGARYQVVDTLVTKARP